MKNILKFIIILIPWFISGLFFQNQTSFYESLNLPFFAFPNYLYGIIWTILYLLITISIFKIQKEYTISQTKQYYKILLINYIFNQLYTFIFFRLQNLFLAFIDCIIIFITSLSLYDETKKLDDKASTYLLPYVFFGLYAVILSLTIYFMNLS